MILKIGYSRLNNLIQKWLSYRHYDQEHLDANQETNLGPELHASDNIVLNYFSSEVYKSEDTNFQS